MESPYLVLLQSSIGDRDRLAMGIAAGGSAAFPTEAISCLPVVVILLLPRARVAPQGKWGRWKVG